MAKAHTPQPVKHFCGMLAGDGSLFTVAAERLAERYGEIDAESDVFDFDFTDYYEKEMGPGLKKKFVSFRTLIDPGEIVAVKLWTNDLEREITALCAAVGSPQRRGERREENTPAFSSQRPLRLCGERAESGRVSRPINLDPGYLTLSKLVLATAKDYSHRLYLGRGIYAEVTLRYQGGRFVEWPWTYPDYKTPEYHAFFKRLRDIYVAQIKDAR